MEVIAVTYPATGFLPKCNRLLAQNAPLRVIIVGWLAQRIVRSERETLLELNRNTSRGWPFSFMSKMILAPRFLSVCLLASNAGYVLEFEESDCISILFEIKAERRDA